MMPEDLIVLTIERLDEAVAWAEACSSDLIRFGVPLDTFQTTVACYVGVQQPEKVRLLTVGSIPRPDNVELVQVADALQILGQQSVGLTLGYAVCMVQGTVSDELLSHELRHVAQYEEKGTIRQFLVEYLRQVAEFGYHDAPFEVDARAHAVSFCGSENRLDALLACLYLDASDKEWIKRYYRQGIKIAEPWYSSGSLSVEISFNGGADGFQPKQFDRFLLNNGINFSCSCGLARAIQLKDEADYCGLYRKLAMLMYVGNLLVNGITRRRPCGNVP